MQVSGKGFHLESALACALAAAAAYSVLGWGGLVFSAVCLGSFAVVHRFGRRDFHGGSALLGCAAACLLTPMYLAAWSILLWGLFMSLCYAIVIPKAFFSVVVGLAFIYGGLKTWGKTSDPSWRAVAVASVLWGLVMSPPMWHSLRSAAQADFPQVGAFLGWRFRFSGPEGGAEKPRFYIAVKDRALRYAPVTVCPPGTRPSAAKRVAGGTLCE